MDLEGVFAWCARGIGLLLGMALLYAALFMLPAEQEQAQSKLEVWWNRLRDVVQDNAMSAQHAFIREAARATSRGFEWLFGEVLSVRFFIISGLLSMLTFVGGMLLFGDYGWAIASGLLLFAFGTIWLASVGQHISNQTEQLRSDLDRVPLSHILGPSTDRGLGGFTSQESKRWRPNAYGGLSGSTYQEPKPWWQDALDDVIKNLPHYISVGLVGSGGTWVFKEALDKGISGWVFGSAVFVSFASDVLAIGFTMFALERIANVSSGMRAAGWLLLDALVAAAMAGLPWVAAVQVGADHTRIHAFLLFVAAANLSTALPAVAYVVVAVTLLLHRAFWVILLRPFYNLFVHSKILHNRKTLLLSGLALLNFSWPGWWGLVVDYAKQVLKLL